MNRISTFIFFILSLAITLTSSISAPVVKSKTDYYLVSGKTTDQIRSSINRNTPVHENGTIYDARTDWFVEWNFLWNQSNASCTITKIRTEVNIQFILPKLQTLGTLPKNLRRKWETYMQALLRHEDGHMNIGIRAANEIERKILNMTSRRTCNKLEIDANHIGNELLKKFRAIEKEYDRKSNHGRNDGTLFP